MRISADNDTLNIQIDDLEWEDIFHMNDGEYVDVFTDDGNMDILFPNWREYVNPNDVLPSLNLEDASRFKKLKISIDETSENKTGEGIYNIVDYDFIPAIDEDSEVMTVSVNDNMDQMMMITIYFKL